MKKLSVTYKAPKGDSKVTEAFGHTFYDGKEETITVDDRTAEKLKSNRHFTCGEAEDVEAAQQEMTPEEEAAAQAADDAKKAAQGTSPPLRGVQINPPEDAPEPEDEETPPEEPVVEGATEHEHGRGFRKGR